MKGQVPVRRIFLAGVFFIIGNSFAFASASAPINVAVHEDRVSATLHNASLERVLAALGQPLGFTAHLDPTLSSNIVTETFNDVPADRVLDRLLRGMNYALAGSSLYVWPRDANSASPATNPEEWTVVESKETPQEEDSENYPTIETWQADFENSSDPEARLEALEDILAHSWEEGEEDIIPTLVTALQDDEPDVRTLALEGLYGIEHPEAEDSIRDAVVKMAESDPLPEHRVQALVWLTERNPQDAKVLLEYTLTDSDPDIRAFAAGLLEEFQAFIPEKED
ncbi:MAG: HEAT repeat domain-containing protein [Nitrospirota bacterium]|nr:MAG: HEAT repeat domain-containing protein [Nitrospirota bacterium]